MPDEEPKVRSVTLDLCDLCLGGAGGECHTPGCALWMNRGPDLPLRQQPSVEVDEVRWETYSGEEYCDVRRTCMGSTPARWRWPGGNCLDYREFACNDCKPLHERDFSLHLAQHRFERATEAYITARAERLAKTR